MADSITKLKDMLSNSTHTIRTNVAISDSAFKLSFHKSKFFTQRMVFLLNTLCT